MASYDLNRRFPVPILNTTISIRQTKAFRVRGTVGVRTQRMTTVSFSEPEDIEMEIILSGLRPTIS